MNPPLQVVTIHPGGSISGLQRKNGLDLKKLGRAKITRSSLILWDEPEQKWYVQFLSPKKILTYDIYYPEVDSKGKSGIVFFSEYEDANYAEVEFLDRCRLGVASFEGS